MTCEQVRDELIAYAREELGEERKAEIGEHLARCLGCFKEYDTTLKVLALTQAADDVSIVRLVNETLQDAVRSRASDLHLDPVRGGLSVRFRIDGVLHDRPTIPLAQRDAVITRIKQMAEMDVTERRLPQTGRIAVTFEGKEFDLRASAIPFFHGEGIAMRVLDRSSVLVGLDKLGFTPEMRETVESLISQPNGLFLAAGPTGSGKSTVLYSALHRLNRPGINILTVEDPVEYLLPGVNQAGVDKLRGMTHAAALRAFLRHDPDVVMVSELRSLEIAELAVEAALTGYLVLSCLHTNGAVEALVRLKDIGVAPFLIGPTLLAVLGARLIRTICPDCKTTATPSEADLKVLGFTPENRPPAFYRGGGCDSCRGAGYKGRTGLYELLVMNAALSELVAEGAGEQAYRKRALEDGILTPFEADARRKVAEGVTTVEEVIRVRHMARD